MSHSLRRNPLFYNTLKNKTKLTKKWPPCSKCMPSVTHRSKKTVHAEGFENSHVELHTGNKNACLRRNLVRIQWIRGICKGENPGAHWIAIPKRMELHFRRILEMKLRSTTQLHQRSVLEMYLRYDLINFTFLRSQEKISSKKIQKGTSYIASTVSP
jgi:hypothetical protein